MLYSFGNKSEKVRSKSKRQSDVGTGRPTYTCTMIIARIFSQVKNIFKAGNKNLNHADNRQAEG